MRVFNGSVLAQGCSAESPRHPHGMNSRFMLRASPLPVLALLGARDRLQAGGCPWCWERGTPRCSPCTPGCRAASFCCAPVVLVMGAGIKVHMLRSEIPNSR